MSDTESEHDESTFTPEQAKLSRKLGRAKFTKLARSITDGIALFKAPAVLAEQRDTLTDLYEECMRMHTIFTADVTAGQAVPEKEKAEKWATALDDVYRKVCNDIDAYVQGKEAADNLAKQQLLEEENAARNAQIAADTFLAHQLLDARQETAAAKAAMEAATAKATTAVEQHEAAVRNAAHLTSVIDTQREALKRRHDEEDDAIARKRLAEDNARAEARKRMDNGTIPPSQHHQVPMSSTPNRHAVTTDRPDLSLIDSQSTYRRYDTTGTWRADASTIPNTVDAWIFLPFEPLSQIAGGADAMVTMAMLSKAKPFGGEPRDWPMFIQTVKSMVHDVFPADVQRLTMLSTMLASRIREGMSQIFNTPLAYRAALTELHRKYGHPHLVVRSYVQHLMSISLCQGGEALETFSTQLNGAVATLDAAGYGHELESSVALEGLVSKLPDNLLARWGRNVTRLFPRIPTLRDLNAWLGFELMGMKNVQGVRPSMQAVATSASSSQYSNRQQQQAQPSNWNRGGNQSSYRATTHHKPIEFFPTVNAVAVDQSGSSKCNVCNEEPGHALESCDKFITMTVDARAKMVWDLDNCFRCLGRHHLSRDCKKNLRCAEMNCGSSAHHTLIHGAARAAPGHQGRASGRGRCWGQ